MFIHSATSSRGIYKLFIGINVVKREQMWLSFREYLRYWLKNFCTYEQYTDAHMSKICSICQTIPQVTDINVKKWKKS